LLKPEWLMRRLPPNKMPAQQHEATGETHTTEPCLILFDTPQLPPVLWKNRHPSGFWLLRYGKSKTRCGSARPVSG
jgi:hypothetical protein